MRYFRKGQFCPVEGFDAQAIQDSLAHACNEFLQPPVRPNIDVLIFEGCPVVVAAIPAMRPSDKPCYIKASDRYKGSFIRTGDGDMRLSPYEVDRLIDEHRQPRHDETIVEGAELSDLDKDLVQALLARERRVHARNFAKLGDTDALVRLGAIRSDDAGKLRPTLAGIMGLLAERRSISTSEVMRHCGRARGTVIKYINELLESGDVEAMERAGSTRQRYRLPKR